jgi:poly(3-hydroxybutyrate) depolymerase
MKAFKTLRNVARMTSRSARASAAQFVATLALAVCAIGVSPLHAADAPLLKRAPISVGGGMAGANRSYSYYVSSKANHAGYNLLVFALHDDGQTAEQFARDSGWIKVAEDSGFVVVFPEAINKAWSSYSGEEDAYLTAVFNQAGRRLTADPRPDDPLRPVRPGEGVPGTTIADVRVGTWQPWQYMSGAGVGARVVQEFAIDHPGLITAVATFNGVAYRSTLAKGDEVSQGYFQNQRGGKTAIPQWQPLKKDVAVPAWLFTAGAPTAGQSKLADYWKHSNSVAKTAATLNVGGFQTAVYTNPRNAVEQVRLTNVPAGAQYNEAMVTAMWQFFSHTARWTSSPNGELGPMMTEPEVNQAFDVRQTKLGDRTYTYYVKAPSSYTKGKSMPLVIALHGFGYPSWMYLNQVKFHEIGEKEGFVTVYPNAIRNSWNIEKPESEDTQLFAQLIDEMAATYNIDKTRVYLQGFSNGSGMTYVAGVSHPQLFAAVAPTSGLGDFDASVVSWVADLKAKRDIRVPMMVVYGAVDSQSSTDGLIPSDGVLRHVIDNMKKYNGITTPETTKTFDSPNAPPYDILVPGGKLIASDVNAHFPKGRFQRYDYLSADTKLPLFSWVWVVDMPHGTAPGESQMIWDYFKNWRRNPDGTLTHASY